MTETNPTGGAGSGADMVEMRLRYRPASDLLIGEARFDVVDEVVDDIDSDTKITWARCEGHGDPFYLRSFSVIGAERRYRDQAPEYFSTSIWQVATSMFHSMSSEPAGSIARLEARAEARLAVSFAELRRVDVRRSGESDIASARSLASSLRDLGSSMRLALDSYDTNDHEVATPARRFVDSVDSLASLVAMHRRSTPSVVADLLDNLRGGLPLSDTERKRLRQTLERANDPDQWKTAALELNNIAAAVRGERRLDPPEGT